MPTREKYRAGERVEMFCRHLAAGSPQQGWLPGEVIETDTRMLAVRFEVDVFTNDGWRVPDRVLWCTHGSRHLRRAGAQAPPDLTRPEGGQAT